MHYKAAFRAALLVAGACLSANAYAEEGAPAVPSAGPEGEIVVTAERRSVALQEAPLAISAVSGEEVLARGYTTVGQVVENSPSVVMQGVNGGVSTQSATGGGGAPNIAIRGLGTDGPNKNSAVAVYEDGVLIGGGGAFFYDVDRVEILRGPQGTLYGRGATAGTVNIITRDPTNEATVSARLGYGSYNSLEAQVVGNMPISGDLALRVGANVLRRDGIYNNGQSGNGEFNTRAKLLWTPSDTFSLLVGGEYYHADRTNAGTVTLSAAAPDPVDWITTEPAGGRNKITYFKIFGRAELDLGFAKLTYLPAYQQNKSENIAYIPPGRVTSVSPWDKTFTQELRLVSNSDSPLQWIAGVFHYANKYEYTLYSASPIAAGGISGYNTTTRRTQNFDQWSVGLFGEASYKFSDMFKVTLGVRQNWDKVLHTEDNLTPSGPEANYFSDNFSSFNWKARLEANLTDHNLLYFTASTGYRPGGSQTNQRYASERVKAYEFGTKNTFGNWLTVNASAFYYDYSGIQMPQAYGIFPALQFTIVNVPAEFYGVEAEFVVKPTSNDTLRFAPVYLHGRLTGDYRYTDPLTLVNNVVTTTGATPPHQPSWSFTAGYDHRFDLANGGSITAGAEVRYQGEQFTDFDISIYDGRNNPVYRQAAYTIVNLSLRYSSADDRFGLGVYATNVGNTIYKVSTTGPRTYLNEPRQIGGYASFKF